MNVIQLNPRYLKAAAVCAAVKDIRYYLCGVLLDVRQRETRTVATDGHRLIVLRRESLENEPDQKPARIIVPAEVLKAMKPGRQDCTLSYDDAETAQACTLDMIAGPALSFKAMEASFPDYERVLPRETPSLEHGAFNLQYLADMTKAAHIAFDTKAQHAQHWPNGTSGTAAITFPGYPDFYGAVMPLRGSGFELPEWLKPTMPCEEPRKLKAVKAVA